MPSSGVQKCALDRKSTRLNSSHTIISYAVFCLKKNIRHTAPHAAHLFSRGCCPQVAHPASVRPPCQLVSRRLHAPPLLDGNPARTFFFNDTATTEIYTLSLHDALPI